MTRRYLIAGALTVVIVVGAIVISSARDDGGDDRASVGTPDPTSATVASPTSTTTAATATTRGPRGNGNAVTFAFAGDVNFPEVWDTEDGPPPNAPPLAEQVRADPHHVLDADHAGALRRRPHDGERRDRHHRRRRTGGREELPLPLAHRRPSMR